jgi:DNA repair protein RadC
MSKGAKRRVDPLKKKLRKAEVVAFLTSSGAIREGLAKSLYEQGLDRWNKLVDGDENYFLSFRGVGLKTAAVLIDLAREKRREFETEEERSQRLSAVKALLEDVPRLRGSATKDMIKKGFDSVEKISKAEPDELINVKGVGPKLALVIIEHAKETLTAKPMEEVTVIIEPPPTTPIIEEATGLSAEESPKEEAKIEGSLEQKGFFSKFLEGLKRFFSPAKDEVVKESPKDAPVPTEAPAPAEVKENETPPVVGSNVTAEVPPGNVTVEAVPEEAPKEGETPPAPEPSIEPPAAGAIEESKDKPLEPVGTPLENKPSFFDKLKGMIFGGPKEETSAAPKVEPKVETLPEPVEDGPKEGTTQQPVVGETVAAGGVTGPERFEDIPGVDAGMAQKLRDSGYMNVAELREAIPEDLMMIDGITKEMAESICSAVKPLG